MALLTFNSSLIIPESAAVEVATLDKSKPLSAYIQYNVSRSYRIGSGDVLSLNVFPQEEFSNKDILVRSDGMASFPRVGELVVTGKTVAEVTAEIRENLNHWIKNANVTVSITKTRPALLYLAGAVMKSGSFEMITDANANGLTVNGDNNARRLDLVLTNVLANAGGIKLSADLSHVQVKRKGETEVEVVDLWKVLKEGEADKDLWLNPGDSIFIPELPQSGLMSDADFKVLSNSILSPKNFPARVLGEVKNPSLVKMEGETPLLSTAIAMAGGYAPQASKKLVAVRRFTDDNHFTTLYVDVEKYDFMLRPNDVVYVGENKMYKAGRFMHQAAQVLEPFRDAATIGAMSSQVFGFGGWNIRQRSSR